LQGCRSRRDEKIVRGPDRFEEMGDTRAGKARRAGVRKEEAGSSETETPEAPRSIRCESGVEKEREGMGRVEMPRFRFWKKGEPERSERPKRARVPTRTNHVGSKRDTAFGVRGNRWSAGPRSERGFGRKRRSGRHFREGMPITLKEEGSGGKSPGALVAERGRRGFCGGIAERVAKPERESFQGVRQATWTFRREAG